MPSQLDMLRRQWGQRALVDRISVLAREFDTSRSGHQSIVCGRAEQIGGVHGEETTSARVRSLREGMDAEQRLHEDDERTA
ncbi:hypothetical protein [Archangium lipolyticum]|uniref:hypothetical protein n=1 Tax=Archangium lipolyticum TaxID=2970465 RepID=UPI00214C46D1|nr:hypothetical protein [Archangium lipolyticum]